MGSTDLELIIKAKDESSKTLDAIGRKAGGLAKVMGKAVAAGALAGGVAIAGLGIAAVKMGLDFEKSMAEVKTLLPTLSEEGFGELKNGVLSLSKELGIATSEAVPALYQAISAGVPPDNVLDFMRTAGKAAIGGVTDLETAVDGITSVINAYGEGAIDAGKASDIMFTAVKLGKTNFEELSASLFNVLPTASSLGIGFEEVAAAMATMTAQGVPTSAAATQLRQAFVEASKGGTKLDLAIREMAGKGLAELVGEGATATGIFEQLRASMPEQGFRDLFGSVEAMNAVMQLTGPNAEAMAAGLAEATASAGAGEGAFKTMAETMSFKFSKAMNLLKVSLTEVGIKILPALTKALSAAIPWLEKNLPKAVAFIEDAFAEVKPIILTVAGIFGDKVIPAVRSLGRILTDDVFPVLKTVFNFLRENKEILAAVGIAIGAVLVPGIIAWTVATLANVGAHIALAAATLIAYAPILLLIAGIALLALGIIKLIQHWDDVTAALGKFKDFIVDAFGDIKDKVLGAISDVIGFLKTNWPLILAILTGPLGLAVLAVITFKDDIIRFFKNLKDGALGIITDFKDRMIRGFTNIATGVFDLVSGLKTDVETKIAELRDKVIGIIAGIPGSIADLGRDFGRAAFGLGRAIIDGLKSGVETGLFLVKGAINAIIGIIERGVNAALDGVANSVATLKSLLDASPGPNPLGNTLQSAINSLRGGISIPRLEGGAFIPPGVVTPAILHGGKRGEIVAPLDRLQGESLKPLLEEIRDLLRERREFNIAVDGTTENEMARSFSREMRSLVFSLGL